MEAPRERPRQPAAELPSAADRWFGEFRRSGDPAALGEVYDRVAAELLRVGVHLTRDPAEAEDLVQATFVTAIERAQAWDPARPVVPWLVGILGNEARRARRSRSTTQDPTGSETAQDAPGEPVDDAVRAELVEHLELALAKLPEAFRPVLVLRIRHRLSAPEIAHALGRPPGTVRSQLARGMEHLRELLPAGLAGGFLALFSAPSRGLDAVREAVVAHAASFAVPTAAATSVLGGILMKKLLAGVACALVLGAGWVLWSEEAEPGRAGEIAASAPPSDLSPVEVATPPAAAQPEVRSVVEGAVEAVTVEAERPEVDPLAGLVLHAWWEGSEEPAADVVVLVSGLAEPGTSFYEEQALRTDASGRLVLEGLRPVHVRARLLRGGEAKVQLKAGETTEIHLRTLPGQTVEGRVVDVDGRGVAGAEIWLSERWRATRGHGVAKADEQGRFEVRSIGPDHYIGARAEGYAPSGLWTLSGEVGTSKTIDILLEASGGSLRGRVTDLRGDPVRGARVLVGSEQSPWQQRTTDGLAHPGPPPQLAVTDEAGEFRLLSLPLGPAPVAVRVAGLAPWSGEAEVLARNTRPLEVRLQPEAVLTGRVTDAAGEPLNQARIESLGLPALLSSTTYSAPDGSFRLAGLAPGEVELKASARAGGIARLDLRLAAGDRREWNPVLEAVPTISGTVVDSAGQPLAGWGVVAWEGRVSGRRWRSANTDVEGRFAVSDLPETPAEGFALLVHEPGGWSEIPRLQLEGVMPSLRPLELVVPDPGSVTGRLVGEVVDPAGEPVTDAKLVAWFEERALWRSFLLPGGRIELENLPPGPVKLKVQSASHPWLDLGSVEIDVGRTRDLGTLRLEGGGRILGRVYGLESADVGSLEVMLIGSDGVAGMIEIQGPAFHSNILRPGTYSLRIQADHAQPQNREVRVDEGLDSSLDVRLEPAGMRVVRLQLGPEGPHPSWGAGYVYGEDGRMPVWVHHGSWPKAGPFELRISLPAGTYTLVAWSEGGERDRFELEVPAPGGELPALVRTLGE